MIRSAYLAFAVFGRPNILHRRAEALRELFKNPALSGTPGRNAC
jgi:hypothetical protein